MGDGSTSSSYQTDNSDGDGCTDVNECIQIATCTQDVDGTRLRMPCINHYPGFECVCAAGQQHPDQAAYPNSFEHMETCVDIDECANGTHLCDDNMTCENVDCSIWGQPCHYDIPDLQSYKCKCNASADYATGSLEEGDLYCPDVDECSDG